MTGLSRRGFLAASGAAMAATAARPAAAAAHPATPTPTTAPATPARRLLTGPFPRTLVFRQAEVLANLRSYPAYAAAFAPFDGVIGKLLTEERTDTVTARNRAYVARFRRENPGTTALLHYNGRARRPGYRTTGWFAGDWLHRAGATVTAAVGPGDTRLRVDDVTAFTLAPDLLGALEADLVLTGRQADGRPDFGVAEQVVLTAVDAGSGTLTVTRAGYGSTPLTLPAGAYLAQHVTGGPWSEQDTRVWFYDLATTAPRGPDGLSAADRIVAEMAADFGPGGPLAVLDGVELDIFSVPDAVRATLDADGDGVADGAYAGDLDAYLAGQLALTAALRRVLGSNRVLTVDSGLQRPDPASVGGVESEGFPTPDDPTLTRWSQGLAGLQRWQATGDRPRLSYPLAKTRPVAGGGADFRRWRVAVAAALLTGSAVSFWDEPSGTTSLSGLEPGPGFGTFPDTFTVWDELLGGDLARPGWLGAPTSALVRAVPGTTPDLYGGAGVSFPAAWTASLVVTGGTLARVGGPGLRLSPDSRAGLTLTLPGAATPGADVVLRCDLTPDPEPGVPAALGRRVDVGLATGSVGAVNRFVVGPARTSVVASSTVTAGRSVRANLVVAGRTPVVLRRIVLQAAPDVSYRTFDGGAVFANPSSQPYTFDVAGLLTGQSFRRLTATAGQDAGVNDGSAVGASLTVPARDALLVRRA